MPVRPAAVACDFTWPAARGGRPRACKVHAHGARGARQACSAHRYQPFADMMRADFGRVESAAEFAPVLVEATRRGLDVPETFRTR